jgi:hypothetical protein
LARAQARVPIMKPKYKKSKNFFLGNLSIKKLHKKPKIPADSV